jgi:hypothetical protein
MKGEKPVDVVLVSLHLVEQHMCDNLYNLGCSWPHSSLFSKEMVEHSAWCIVSSHVLAGFNRDSWVSCYAGVETNLLTRFRYKNRNADEPAFFFGMALPSH